MELVIDTASGALSVALIDGFDLIAEHHEVIGRGHAETIVAIVAGIVAEHGAAVRGILVDVGPGSYTGVRIGVAAARAFGLAWDVPVMGIGALALIAAAAFARDASDLVVAVADAGRNQVYWQTFARGGCAALSGPAATGSDLVIVPPGATVAGTGAALLAGRHVAPGHPRASDARWLPAAARGAPVPLYLRAAGA